MQRSPHPRVRGRALATVGLCLALVTCADENARPTGPSPVGESSAGSEAAGATEPVVLVGAGSIADCGTEHDAATAALLAGIGGTVFTTGDNVRTGSTSEFTNCYAPTWGAEKARTRPVAGEREYWTSGAAGYYGYFGSAAGEPDAGYDSFDLGAWHVVVLNSSVSMAAGSAQEQWLRQDLAAHPRQCTLGIWHYPRFSSYSTYVRAAIKPVWEALYAAGADVVVNGHYRFYERYAPQTPDGVADPERGIRQFTIGLGGQGVWICWGRRGRRTKCSSTTYTVS